MSARAALNDSLGSRMPSLAKLRGAKGSGGDKKRVAYVGLGVVGALALSAGALLKTPFFAIEDIRINPVSQTDLAPPLRAAGIEFGSPLVLVRESATERRIEALPTVVSAEVSSDWPHVVTIDVVERRPIAMAPTNDGRWARIGEGGIVLAVVPAPEAGLPVPLGVTAPSTPGQSLDGASKALTEVAGMMPPSLRPRVAQVIRDEQGLRLVLDTGTVVQMGDDTQVPEKLMAAATIASNTDTKKLTSIDVTLPALPLATPKG